MTMNNKVSFLCFLFLLLFIYSCYKCKDLTKCSLPETGEKYFKNYTNGSIWIYQNKNQSKIDSVKIKDYQSIRRVNKTDECTEWERREMIINSKYLALNNISCLYENPNCDRSYFLLQGLDFSISLDSKKGVDTLFSSILGSNIITIDSLLLPTGFYYYKVVNYNDRLWFAPYVGLIQYVSYDNSDTLFIKENYIK